MDYAQTHNAKVQSVLFVIGSSSSVWGTRRERSLNSRGLPRCSLRLIDVKGDSIIFHSLFAELEVCWSRKFIKDSEECVFVETVKWRSSRRCLEATGNCKRHIDVGMERITALLLRAENIWLNYWCRKILLRANFRRKSISSWNIISCSSSENRL